MTYILDSDVVIDYFKKRAPYYREVTMLLNQEHDELVISAITLAEVRAGWDSAQAETFRPIISSLFTILDVTANIADEAGAQLKFFAQRGRTLSTTDTLIAATALLYECCLLTRNTKDFPQEGLKLYQLPFAETEHLV